MNWICLAVTWSVVLEIILAREILLNRTDRTDPYGHKTFLYDHGGRGSSGYQDEPPTPCCCGLRQRPYNAPNYNPSGQKYGAEEGRIITHQNEFTWVATLHFSLALIFSGLEESLVCGGSLLTERYILTSVICVIPYVNVPYFLVANLGNHDLQVDADFFDHLFLVCDCYVHCKFDRETLDYNVALLKLHRPVRFTDYIVPICLPPDDLYLVGKFALSIGWTTDENGYDITDVDPELKNGYVPVISKGQCQNIYNGSWTISSTMVCAAQRRRAQHACNYDFGLSLAYDCGDHYTIVGIMSHPFLFDWPKLPAIYTRISAVLDDLKEFLHYTSCSTICRTSSSNPYTNHQYGSHRFCGYYDIAPQYQGSATGKNDGRKFDGGAINDRIQETCIKGEASFAAGLPFAFNPQSWLPNGRERLPEVEPRES